MTSSPRPERALVTLSGVGKAFPGGATALRGMDLTLREGEVTALLGPSGCGKSTALRIVAGLLAPTAGSVTRHLPLAAGQVGAVLQDATLMPWASVARNVWLPLRLRGIPFRQARPRIEAVLASVGLADAADAWPASLSGGMRMRVAVARALVTRPRLLLMDEPFAALDEITRDRLDDDLLRLRADLGSAVLFVTHSVAEAVYLADRVLVMTPAPGRVAAEIAVAPPARGPAFRHSAAHAALSADVSAALARAMAA